MFASHLAIDMPRKNAVLRWLGPKGIHPVKPRVACFQATVVDVGVAIISDANGFSAHAHQAFDVMSVLSQLWYTRGFEYDGLTSRRSPKIIRQSIDKKMISTGHLETDHILSLLEGHTTSQTGSVPEIFRWEPYGVSLVSDLQPLFGDQGDDPDGFGIQQS